jgi:hypothetical protein
MDVGVLFSGGKDSALAALVLEPLADVTLVGVTFGVTDAVSHSRAAARALDLPFEVVELPESVAEDAVATMLDDGFPRNGIQAVHEAALETVAEGDWDALADGTRRDDRVPSVPRPTAQSLEDRFGVSYLAPLAGFGREAIDTLVAERLRVETGPSEDLDKGDYEAELRAIIRDRSDAAVADVFPAHTQSRVVGRAG